MKTIRGIVKTPSSAIEFMVDGLIDAMQRDDFKIDMTTYAYMGIGFCAGCAATCAIQKITGKKLSYSRSSVKRRLYLEQRAKFFGFSEREQDEFEQAIDAARCGNFGYLFHFFEINYSLFEYDLTLIINETKEIFGSLEMSNSNYGLKIEAFRFFASKLREVGL